MREETDTLWCHRSKTAACLPSCVMRHDRMTRSQSPRPRPQFPSRFSRCHRANEGRRIGVPIGKSLIRHQTRRDPRHHQDSQQTEMDGEQVRIGPQGAPPPMQQVAASSVLPFDECLSVEVLVRSRVTFDVRILARARQPQASVVNYQRARLPSHLLLLLMGVTMIKPGGWARLWGCRRQT